MDIINLAKLFTANEKNFQFLHLINNLVEGSLKFREGDLSELETYSKNAVYELESSGHYYLED